MDRLRAPEHPASVWQARLSLGFERRGAATVLSRRAHVGPLRVQKPLYPEGEAVCHVIALHPPAGIAGGDALEIAAHLGPAAHALITTPGAGKWYRSAGPWASQALSFDLAAGARLEWLPQETIVFDGARADLRTDVTLAADACFAGSEIVCLGRRASGETFAHGALHLSTRIERDGKPLWLERGRLDGGAPLLHAPAGLAGFSVSGSFLVAAERIEPALVQACRGIEALEPAAMTGVTALPGLVVARYLGHASEAARAWFAALWAAIRPHVFGRAAQTPRIWNT